MKKVFHEFECVVTDVLDDAVIAESRDITGRRGDEIIEVPFTQFKPCDRALLVPGCVFYWSVGINGPSKIRVMRRKWTKKQIESIKRESKRLFRKFGGES